MTNPQKKTATPEPVGNDKMLKFTITGSYYNSKKEIIDFDGVEGVIPFCDEDNGVGSMHVRDRYARKWVRDAKKADGEPRYPDRIHKMRQVHIDDVQATKGTLSFVGKNIKDLSIDEMQDLAVSKDLRGVPLPEEGMSRRDVLVRCYAAYSDKVLKKEVKINEPDFNFMKLPAILLDSAFRTEKSQKFTNEEIIGREQQQTITNYGEREDAEKRISLAELKTLADGKNIAYSDMVTHKELYAKIFSA